MKKLIYLFLAGLLLVGCRGNRYYLNRVEAWHDVDGDSMSYYLLKVDSAELSSDERNVYDFYRLRASYAYLISLSQEQLDEVTARLEQYFFGDKRKVFLVGMMRATYAIYWARNYVQADSFLNQYRHLMQQKSDSAFWYYYKYGVKYSLKQTDSAFHYVHGWLEKDLLSKERAYNAMAYLHNALHQPDSAIFYYGKAMEHSDDVRSINFYNNRILDMVMEQKDYKRASEVMEQIRQGMRRSDIPYVNLVEGDLWMEMHQPDSAMKHYRIATRTGNGYVAMQAYERMGNLMQWNQDFGKAFDMYQQSVRVRGDLYNGEFFSEGSKLFENLKMKSELAELQVDRQQHLIIIMSLCLFMLGLVGVSLFYFYRKRTVERKRLMQENMLLRQNEELASLREKQLALREKEARLREELFKRMNVVNKLSVSGKERHVFLSDTDWEEIYLMVNDAYHNFIPKLRTNFPALTDKDINFCCLVRMNLSLQSLADIYCISKNSVSRRKLRMKEKMELAEETTLDEYLSLL